MTRSLRLGFAGSPDFASTVLAALLDSSHEVVVAYSQPDRPAGRGRKLQPSAVKALAQAHGVEVATPSTLRGPEASSALAGHALDALIVAAYGLILPRSILTTPKYGCLNVHASVLPRWRGAAPVEHAIMAGDRETGVSIMQMDVGMDTGPVLDRAVVPLDGTETGGPLTSGLATLGAERLLAMLESLPDATATPQDERFATYAAKLTSATATIDWREPAPAVARLVRALADRQPASSTLDGTVIRILEAAPVARAPRASPGTLILAEDALLVRCGFGALKIRRVQIARGKGTPLDVRDARNGYPTLLADGRVFDLPASAT